MELTIAEYHDALRAGCTTCARTVSDYLSRIALYNPTLGALITINPHALDDAQRKDREGLPHPLLPLHGVPVIVKDTYATACMPTTSGVRALRSLTTKVDALVVQRLLAAGAILLAKANLHEFSLEGVTLSSLGGQTLNPYDLTRTPGGSSGGTAAALAANLALVGCGGDTVNSMRSPASACSLAGLRPSKGRVEKTGIMPVTWTQDVAGPMARTVRDVRILFDVMKNPSEVPSSLPGPEPVSVSIPLPLKPSVADTNTNPIHKIGILIDYFPDESTPDGPVILQTITQALHLVASKTSNRIQFLPLPHQPTWDVARLRAEADTQAFEFRSAMDDFLQSSIVEYTPHRTLESVTASGEFCAEALTPAFWQTQQGQKESENENENEEEEEGNIYTPTSPQYRKRLSTIASLKDSVSACFDNLGLTAIVYPHQRQLVARVGETVQPGRNGILAALVGWPAVCIPAGFSPPDETAPLGVPIGIELMGRFGQDEQVLELGEVFEGIVHGRKTPLLEGVGGLCRDG
ncbi:amidase [Aspergillus affinis]|uniref:amidase n=1 Tax=Aspergillus affinis TaxID=1070780 RepID=UPI0022FEE782|nr:amidase [Aspergillus affinis]KAI9043991.1 amidase [Aspergillus affinis]